MFKIKPISIFTAIFILLTGSTIYFVRERNQDKQVVLISVKDYILSSFLSELPEINKKLPLQIDNETTLLSITYENNKILSIYRLTSTDLGQEFIQRIIPAITKQTCHDDMKRKFLDVDIDFLSRYQNPAGEVKFEVAVNKAICAHT